LILLIGATGFLGRHTFQMLLERGMAFRCLIRHGSSVGLLRQISHETKKEAGFVPGNLLSEDSVYVSLEGIDAVIYLVRLEYEDLLKNFLSAAKRRGIRRVVFISSTTVLVPADTEIKKAKMASEEQIKRSGLDYTILRPSMIYGGEGDNNFSKMVSFIEKRGFFLTFGKGRNQIQPVYVRDVAKAILDVLDNPRTICKTYEISGAEALRYRDMLETVRRKMKKDFKIIRLPIALSEAALCLLNRIVKKPLLNTDQVNRMRYDKVYDHSQAAEDFAYEPITFEEGIEKLLRDRKK
jgi:nucleoside-diphosphate-sugar epimerase